MSLVRDVVFLRAASACVARVAWVAVLALGCARPAPATPGGAATTPGGAATSPAVAERKLLCARIGVETASVEPAPLVMDGLSLEGGAGSAFVRDRRIRVVGELLGESYRETFDLRFEGDDLVCSRTAMTSIATIHERTAENPEGRPPFWREDVRVYRAGVVLHATVDQAPGVDEEARSVADTIALAKELRAKAVPATKPR